jgi:putative phosphonate metabolism protein
VNRGDARVAVYYGPARGDVLWQRGANWLGRDPANGAVSPQPELPGIEEITAEARQYGFHCTLKPPMRLQPGTDWFALVDAAEKLARDIPAFTLPPLMVANLHGFLALRETFSSAELQSLADACVARLDEFRAPAGEAELARRRKSGLSPAQEKNLLRWGYPYVFDTWFFHMTLTRRLTEEEHAIYRPAAEAYFATALAEPHRVEDICLFTQREPGAPFILAQRLPLRG